jgi:demethoxyubiquinone hydroxylase (CLK1/Coq7/Cat5 family)
MQKLLIRATKEIATKLEEKLRHHYDVQLDTLGDQDNNNNTNAIVCEIKAKVKRNWITICRFAPNENLKDILTMFEVNYELKARRI